MLAGLIMASCSADGGSVIIRLPKDFTRTALVVSHVTIDNAFKAKKVEDLIVVYDTLTVQNGLAQMKLDPAGAARYNIESPVPVRTEPDFYAAPGENLEVVINSFAPLDYAVKGTELMEDLTALAAVTGPIQQEYVSLGANDDYVPEAKVKELMDRYDAAIKQFAAEHPDSPAVPFVITDLSGDDFKEIYDNLAPRAGKSILMPYAELYNRQVEQMIKEREEEQARKAKEASGTVPAPDFTLPDPDGRKVSLSDFRGKWVVIDFWGSWCGWCIKGFPALKDAYAKYGDRIVIIGVDCNDTKDKWRAAVKKYELPWLNLYNGNDRSLYKAYNIQGFPTKAIINPDGKIVDFTVGEDPSFFTRLASFIE